MTLLFRTLIATPVALVAVALYAGSTTTDDRLSLATETVDGTVSTDAEGLDEGLLTAVIVGPDLDRTDLRITVFGNTRRSLRVSSPTLAGPPQRVSDDVVFTLGLPGSCEEFDPAEDTDVPGACTVSVPLSFEGGREQTDEFSITAAIRRQDPDEISVVGPFTLDLDYDADPPAQD